MYLICEWFIGFETDRYKILLNLTATIGRCIQKNIFNETRFVIHCTSQYWSENIVVEKIPNLNKS